MKAGASDYIEKSKIYPDIIERSIRHAIDRHRIMHQLVVSNRELELARFQQEKLATHDTLTGLPNRTLLLDRLDNGIELARRQSNILGVMFVDLDQFKQVNDILGHTVGDHLLQAAAKRITSCLRQSDTLARFGGDEFIILLNLLNSLEDAENIASKLNEVMSRPFQIEEHRLLVTASIGIATYPDDASTAEALINKSDLAMYSAKQLGRNTWCYNADITSPPSLQRDLQEHIQQHRFILYYQPILSLDGGIIIGAEALVRWDHPEMGLLQPDKFIPIAEATNLILPLGEWVLCEACRQNRAWQDAGFTPIHMAVNLSPRQIEQESLIEIIHQALRDSGMDAKWLTLEMTENCISRQPDVTARILNKLRHEGLKVSLDDFGTGYSSLSYLRQLPIDILKIDRSFVRDVTIDVKDGAIVRAIVTLAKSLSISIIAEGVETAEQETFLRDIRCESMQGFLISKPVSADDFTRLLENNQKPRGPEISN